MPDPLPPAQHGARAPRSRTPAPGASASAPPPRRRGGTPPSPRPPWLSPACWSGRSSPPAAARPTRPTSRTSATAPSSSTARSSSSARASSAILVLAAITAELRRRQPQPTAGRSRPARASALAAIGRDVVRRRRGVIGALGAGGPRRPGRDRPARGRRPARRHELVLPPASTGPAGSRATTAAGGGCCVEVGRGTGAACCSASRCSGSRASTARASRSSCSCRTCGSQYGVGGRARGRRRSALALTARRRRRSPSRLAPAAARTSGCSSSPACCSASCCVVMVGESVQEMQLAGWLPTTHDPRSRSPGWLGLLVRGVPDGRGARRPGRSPPRS